MPDLTPSSITSSSINHPSAKIRAADAIADLILSGKTDLHGKPLLWHARRVHARLLTMKTLGMKTGAQELDLTGTNSEELTNVWSNLTREQARDLISKAKQDLSDLGLEDEGLLVIGLELGRREREIIRLTEENQYLRDTLAKAVETIVTIEDNQD